MAGRDGKYGQGQLQARGSALLLALVFLALLGMLAGGALQRGILSLRLAGNAQFREEAQQQAESLVDALAQEPANFPVSAGIGHTLCIPGDPDEVCAGDLAALPQRLRTVPERVELNYRVSRRRPLFLGRLPRRLDQSEVSSSRAFHAAVFEAQARVDGAAMRLGTAEVARGVAVLVPRGEQRRVGQ